MKIKASRCSALMVAAGVWLGCAGPLHAQETTPAASQDAAQQATVPNPLQRLFGIQPAPAATEPAAAEQPGRPLALNRYRKASTHRGHGRKTARTHRASRNAAAETGAASDAKPATKASTKADAKAAVKPDAVADADTTAPVPMPAAVANARAQAPDDTPATATPPAPDADVKTSAAGAETGVVAADELNEVDRAMAAQAAVPAEPAPTLALASVTPEPVTTGQAASASDDASGWARASLIGKIFIGFGGLLTLASALRMLIA